MGTYFADGASYLADETIVRKGRGFDRAPGGAVSGGSATGKPTLNSSAPEFKPSVGLLTSALGALPFHLQNGNGERNYRKTRPAIGTGAALTNSGVRTIHERYRASECGSRVSERDTVVVGSFVPRQERKQHNGGAGGRAAGGGKDAAGGDGGGGGGKRRRGSKVCLTCGSYVYYLLGCCPKCMHEVFGPPEDGLTRRRCQQGHGNYHKKTTCRECSCSLATPSVQICAQAPAATAVTDTPMNTHIRAPAPYAALSSTATNVLPRGDAPSGTQHQTTVSVSPHAEPDTDAAGKEGQLWTDRADEVTLLGVKETTHRARKDWAHEGDSGHNDDAVPTAGCVVPDGNREMAAVAVDSSERSSRPRHMEELFALLGDNAAATLSPEQIDALSADLDRLERETLSADEVLGTVEAAVPSNETCPVASPSVEARDEGSSVISATSSYVMEVTMPAKAAENFEDMVTVGYVTVESALAIRKRRGYLVKVTAASLCALVAITQGLQTRGNNGCAGETAAPLPNRLSQFAVLRSTPAEIMRTTRAARTGHLRVKENAHRESKGLERRGVAADYAGLLCSFRAAFRFMRNEIGIVLDYIEDALSHVPTPIH